MSVYSVRIMEPLMRSVTDTGVHVLDIAVYQLLRLSQNIEG